MIPKAINELSKYKNKVVWLASYPKSGNTWLRIFLHNLFIEHLDINNLFTDFYLPNRDLLDDFTFVNSRYLYNKEIKQYQRDLLNHKIKISNQLLFIKTHELFDADLITTENTHAVIYIVRHPFAVVSSYSKFRNKTIDNTIRYMSNSKQIISLQDGLNDRTQVEQKIGSWSSHVKIWVENKRIPIYIVKYEDMMLLGQQTFSELIQNLSLDFTDKEILKAINASSFNALKQREELEGFRERPNKVNTFFRKGEINSWKEDLNKNQQDRIIDEHQEMMRLLNYI